jgi:hypothetical protein
MISSLFVEVVQLQVGLLPLSALPQAIPGSGMGMTL